MGHRLIRAGVGRGLFDRHAKVKGREGCVERKGFAVLHNFIKFHIHRCRN